MASVDGSRAFLGDSDETFELFCDPCKSDDVIKEGKHYCQECKEYLCNECKDAHRKVRITKTHSIIPEREMREIGSVREPSGCNIYCSCNQNQQVEVYCEDHKDVICNSCKKIKHWKCKAILLNEKCTSYTTAHLNVLVDKITSLKSKTENLQQERSTDLRKLESLINAARTKIKTFRKEIDMLLDKLEQTTSKDLDNLETEQKQNIEHQSSTLTAALQMLSKDHKLLEDAKSDGRRNTMFASDIQVSKCLQEYEAVLNNVQGNTKASVIVFERNKKIVDLLGELNSLGGLHEAGEIKTQCGINLLDMKMKILDKVDMSISGELGWPWITGSAFMKNGELLACDYEHNKVKLLDRFWTLNDNIIIDKPYDVSVIDDNSAIITCPGPKQLQVIQVLPKLKAGRVIPLDKKCWGVDVSNGEIYVTCHDGVGKTGEVRVLDMKGDMKRRIGVKRDGNFIFTRPEYVAVSRSEERVYVSDQPTATVMCLSKQGDLLFQFKHDDLKEPRGIYVDATNNVLVCDCSDNTLKLIGSDGRKRGNYVQSIGSLSGPSSVALREKDNILVVGAFDYIFVFKPA